MLFKIPLPEFDRSCLFFFFNNLIIRQCAAASTDAPQVGKTERHILLWYIRYMGADLPAVSALLTITSVTSRVEGVYLIEPEKIINLILAEIPKKGLGKEHHLEVFQG